MKKLEYSTICLLAGALLLLLGGQLRAVQTFELSPNATRLLAAWAGPSPQTTEGAVRQIAIDATQYRHRITPPEWLGWSLLSVGSVLTAHGMMRRK